MPMQMKSHTNLQNKSENEQNDFNNKKKERERDEEDENQDKFRIQWKIAQHKIPAKRNIAFIFS